MKKSAHVIWVCPTSQAFYRAKGEVRCRPGSVVPKLAEQGLRINVLIPHDPTLLPKTKIAPARIMHHVVHLAQDYPIEIMKLTRGAISPGIYMAKLPPLEPAIASAVFSKAALALAQQLRRPVDIFHLFDWESGLLPLYLEMEKSGARLFKETRTFMNVTSLREQGNFSPAILSYLGIPKPLFHPDGIEFYGKLSFLKSGLLFSDGVGLIENGMSRARRPSQNGNGMEGVLDALSFKLRRWPSDRSVRSHLDAYAELLSMPKTAPLLPTLIEKVQENGVHHESFIDSWGPVPPERYGINALSFMVQSPQKAFTMWEWSGSPQREYGLVLEDRTNGDRQLLAKGVGPSADYWVDVAPDREYVMEFVGINGSGDIRPLLRSRPLRTPRTDPSPNTEATFIDVRSRKRYTTSQTEPAWREQALRLRGGFGTSAWEWVLPSLAEELRRQPEVPLPSSHGFLPSSMPGSLPRAPKEATRR